MDVPGFFDKQTHLVAGEMLTLDALEKQKLPAPFGDARIHFALVCAAISCPPLRNRAYVPEQLEAQLQAQARASLQHENFIRVLPAEKKVLVSEIFKWYEKDFCKEAPSLITYLNRYRKVAVPAHYALGYYFYNWRLNEVRAK